jgi:HPt (histidine-containing phosphotransfer) domain-containing protein
MAKRASPGGPDQELEELRARYRRALPGKARAVQEAAAALTESGEGSQIEALYLLAHRLRGSAAIYGFAGVSEAAATLEAFVVAAMEGPSLRSAPWRERLEAHVSALTAAAAAAVASTSTVE